MAGIVAGSIAGAWSPIERGHGDSDSLKFARERSKSDLSKDVRMEVHPDTKKDDQVVIGDNPVDVAGHAPPSQSTNTTPQFGYGPYGGEPSNTKSDADQKKDDGAA
jgi:Ca2+-transporting ATPase